MNLLEIVMLIIGIFIIIISCWLISRPDKDNLDSSYEGNTKDDKQYIESLSSLCEEITAKTEDYLSRLSNEKIMAVSEYSDQILEKIDRNHEEVVFLYNMLAHKEKELKEAVKEINDIGRRAKQDNNDNIKLYSVINTQHSENIKNLNIEDHKKDRPASINNEEVLNLYSQGKSVLEISRHLGIGQGEVKLIIDLFKDR